MDKRQLSITVGREGEVKTDFLNFTGAVCLEAGQQLRRVLAEFGLTTDVTSVTPKPELFQSPAYPVEQQEIQQVQEGEH
jgi:hypothetical protein